MPFVPELMASRGSYTAMRLYIVVSREHSRRRYRAFFDILVRARKGFAVKHAILTLALACLSTCAARAQMQHPPAPELKKLDYLIGDWRVEGDLKPSSFGPGGKITETFHHQWMQGNFFLITHCKYSGLGRDGVEYEVMGYDSKKQQYTYESFNSDGEHVVETGSFDAAGKVWTFNISPETPDAPKGRYTETELSPTSYAFKEEVFQNGNWSIIVEGKGTKQSATP